MMLRKKILKSEKRSFERILHHYEIEKKLAKTLLCSTSKERAFLYNSLYDELFKTVPDHPQLTQKITKKNRQASAKRSLRLINRHLTPESIFLEIGAGDCVLSIEAAKRVGKVYAVDVSKELIRRTDLPSNLEVIISDGTTIPLNVNSVDICYSNQLIEHLHPDDVIDQLTNIYKILKKGGLYYCITPNRITGPHDISRYFDDIASCFHLREYTNKDLYKMFRKVGFRFVHAFIGKQGLYLRFPLKVKILLEKICNFSDYGITARLVHSPPVRLALRIVMLGIK